RGVWVPGLPVEVPRDRRSPGEALLVSEALESGRGGEPVHAPVDLEIRAGEALVVTGPNGAGKSTLALTLAGLLPPVRGTVRATASLRGDVTAEAPIRWRPRQLTARIGTVFQQPEHQFVAARVHDEVAAGPRALGRPAGEVDDRVAELLATLRLGHLADANPFTLSGGEQRRLSVATVLAAAPRVIVLDEPTFGQDRRTWQELVRLVAALVDERGCAVVAVTHDADVERVLGDRVLRLGAA
ncbi:ABC transporter ATP-binding protein, partial [Agrococcus sp. HG114]|uniref:ABC transporter ATP-binding protein n=1 Tax=Agrococcus sp. HG114 TaxID=2969757 RepID=UPI00215B263A